MFALIFGLSFLANAQDAKSNQPKGYQFTDIKRLPATSVNKCSPYALYLLVMVRNFVL